jgi:uncharacterized protein YjeT (DUF2065 family)
MAKTLGGIFLAAFVVMFIINGVYMLIFPQAWLRLPEWHQQREEHFAKDTELRKH